MQTSVSVSELLLARGTASINAIISHNVSFVACQMLGSILSNLLLVLGMSFFAGTLTSLLCLQPHRAAETRLFPCH